jgi:hypothetical protein
VQSPRNPSTLSVVNKSNCKTEASQHRKYCKVGHKQQYQCPLDLNCNRLPNPHITNVYDVYELPLYEGLSVTLR